MGSHAISSQKESIKTIYLCICVCNILKKHLSQETTQDWNPQSMVMLPSSAE